LVKNKIKNNDILERFGLTKIKIIIHVV